MHFLNLFTIYTIERWQTNCSVLLCLNYLFANGSSSTNETIPSSNETVPINNATGINIQSVYNQLLDFVPSKPLFYSIILNFLVVGYLIINSMRERGCMLPDGERIPNGWEQLSNDCQEKYFCHKNKIQRMTNNCDLDKFQCMKNGFGNYFCQDAVLIISSSRSANRPFLIDFNGKN